MPRSFSLSEREADLAIMVGRPEKGRLRVRKLVDYALGLYASKDYLDRAGPPKDLADLTTHSLVGYVDDLIYTPELNYAREFLRDWRSSIEISTAIGQFEAVRAGVGIGICHDFMAADTDLDPAPSGAFRDPQLLDRLAREPTRRPACAGLCGPA